MYRWTDRKIRIHAFYCMLGISLLQHLHKQAQSAWNGISSEQLLEELRQIQQFVLLTTPSRGLAVFAVRECKWGYRVRLNGKDHQWGKDPLKEVVGWT